MRIRPQKDFRAQYPFSSRPAVPRNDRPVGDLGFCFRLGLPMKGLLISTWSFTLSMGTSDSRSSPRLPLVRDMHSS